MAISAGDHSMRKHFFQHLPHTSLWIDAQKQKSKDGFALITLDEGTLQ